MSSREWSPGAGGGPLDAADTGGGGGSQTVLRALEVLTALRNSPGDAGVSQLAREVGMPVSTVHRILRTLVGAGYVAQNAGSERYRLGREAFLLGQAAARTLGFDAVQPLLERLSRRTGESANLVVRSGDAGLVVAQVESPQPLRFSQPVGTRVPLHCSSSGKVLLAYSPDPDALVAALGTLERFTPDTITAPDRLLAQVRDVLARGYAVNVGERNPGVAGVAAPVGPRHGVAGAAVTVHGPQVRFGAGRVAELAAEVLAIAAEVADVLPDTAAG